MSVEPRTALKTSRPSPCVAALTMLVLIALAMTTPAAADEAATPERPNILLIVTDDQGWWDLGVHGNEIIETPTLDRLAGEGVRFSHFYVSPVCAPTRAGLMTGRYYLRTGVYNTRFGGDTMRDDEVTLAEVLSEAGYRTGMLGKWHLGHYARYAPGNQGFERFFGFLHGHIERYDYSDQLQLNGEHVETRGHITDLLTDAAIEFIRAESEQPFFCYLPYNVPHSPFIAGDAHAEQERGDALIMKYLQRGLPLRDARIYAMIERCDQNVARLLDVLDEEGLADSTIVLFMSDNGGVSRHEKLGLRGGKASAFEGGVRSPLLIRRPDEASPGAVFDAPVHCIDLLPTLCELLEIDPPQEHPLDGRSFLPVLNGETEKSPHEYLYHIWDRHRPSMSSRWAIQETATGHKLVGSQLFNLRDDPGETRDIADGNSDVAARLRSEFESWLKDVTAGQTFEPVPIEIGRPDQPKVEIQMSWADVDWRSPEETAPHYEFRGYDWDTLTDWDRPGVRARWHLHVVEPGEYEVVLWYGAREESAGGTYRLSLADTTVTGTVEPTLTQDVFHKREIGLLRLDRTGDATLSFEPLEVHGGELMALNRIVLRRTEAPHDASSPDN